MKPSKLWTPRLRERLRSGLESTEWMARVTVAPPLVMRFTRQLASMLGAGIPLVPALDSLARQTEEGEFTEVLWTVHKTLPVMASSAASLPSMTGT